jgi:hypothetical protein
MKMVNAFIGALLILSSLTTWSAEDSVVVKNPGDAHGQLVVITQADLLAQSDKLKDLSPLSIPVFEDLPEDLSVVAAVITLKEQDLLSHVQLKSRSRGTPNLDISTLPGGLDNPLLDGFKDGDWVHLTATYSGFHLTASSKENAQDAYEAKKAPPRDLPADLQVKGILSSSDNTWQDFSKIGSKAANYAELAKALNSSDEVLVRPAYALPYSYYKSFIETNPSIATEIAKILRDPIMKRAEYSNYRSGKLTSLQDLMKGEASVVDPDLLLSLVAELDKVRDEALPVPARMKFRSSTNAEDLPFFNGAGLYESKAYKPFKTSKKDGSVKEKSLDKKIESAREALLEVWASVWNLRAYDEREVFGLPHDQIMMGVQINPSFSNEAVSGVVVTTNVPRKPEYPGKAVYIESQRGDFYRVENPQAGVRSQKILVLINPTEHLNRDSYQVVILQESNIADDNETILPSPNPNPVMSTTEAKEVAYHSLRAEDHFRPLLGNNNPDFAFDLEFKYLNRDLESRKLYFKQGRPYIGQ